VTNLSSGKKVFMLKFRRRDSQGGAVDPFRADATGTTGTACSTRREHVGRITPDDVGYFDVTGAEVRAWNSDASDGTTRRKDHPMISEAPSPVVQDCGSSDLTMPPG
jgi:hypothetical protein